MSHPRASSYGQRQNLRCDLLGHQTWSEELIIGTVKRRPRQNGTDPMFFNSIRGTPRNLVLDDEVTRG